MIVIKQLSSSETDIKNKNIIKLPNKTHLNILLLADTPCDFPLKKKLLKTKKNNGGL
jgi:hypothetical protein